METSSAPETPRQVSVAETENILVWSFYHSQGRPLLQEHILSYIGKSHPHWRFPAASDFDPISLGEKMRAGAAHAAPHHKHHVELKSNEQLGNNAKMYLEYLHDKKEVSILKIASEIVAADELRVLDGGSSFFMSHVLDDEHVLGPEVFKEISTDIHTALQNPEARAEFIRKTPFRSFAFRDRIVGKMQEIFGNA